MPRSVSVTGGVSKSRKQQAAIRARAGGPRSGPSPLVVGWIIFALLVIGGGIRVVLTLPSAQDRVVKLFLQETARGNYHEACELIDGGTYSALAERSSVRGIPGGQVVLRTLLANEATIADELPHANLFVTVPRLEELRTQKDKNRDRKTVQFRMRFEVFSSPRLPFAAAPEKAMPFTIEGTATTTRAGGAWKVHALDFQIIPDRASDLQALLRLFGGTPPI